MDKTVELFARFEYLSSRTISFPTLGKFPRYATMAIERTETEGELSALPGNDFGNGISVPMEAISFAQFFNYNSLTPDLAKLVRFGNEIEFF